MDNGGGYCRAFIGAAPPDTLLTSFSRILTYRAAFICQFLPCMIDVGEVHMADKKELFYDDSKPLPGWMKARDMAAASIFTMLLERRLNKDNKESLDIGECELLAAEAWEIAEVFRNERPHTEGEPGSPRLD